jgi:limonene-1,2-epoxide hydrolase
LADAIKTTGGCAVGTTEAEQIVDRFVAAWERADVDELLDFFADDGVWQPGPVRPSAGKPALREAFTTWLGQIDQLGVEIHLQVSDGRVVMHERTDRFVLGDREVTTPVGAVFEIEDGHITAWREYFDMSPFIGS